MDIYPDYYLLPLALAILIVTSIAMEKRGLAEQTPATDNEWLRIFCCWSFIIIAIWLLAWWGFHYAYNHSNFHNWLPPNEFGDMFGALTCLFSGLAIAGVVAMLRQQHQEMKEARNEFSKQTEQFEAQTQLLKQQIDEAQHASAEQIKFAKKSQTKDEIYRRIDYVKRLESNCCVIKEEPIQSNTAITHPVSHKGVEALDIIIENVGKIDKWSDTQVETHANNNTFTNGSTKAWIKSCLQLTNFIYHERTLDKDEKLYYLDFFISSIPAPAANLLYLWTDMIELSGANETMNYLLQQGLISPPEYYRNIGFQNKFRRCVQLNNEPQTTPSP